MLLCCKDEEMVDHLVLHCDFAFEMWGLFFSLMGLSWVMPANLQSLFVLFTFPWR